MLGPIFAALSFYQKCYSEAENVPNTVPRVPFISPHYTLDACSIQRLVFVRSLSRIDLSASSLLENFTWAPMAHTNFRSRTFTVAN